MATLPMKRVRSSDSTPSSTSTTGAVPRVGGVRCYWALVRPRFPSLPGSKLELVFVHPDPVLAVHLARQKMSLMGRGVIEFIHPAEREQARNDLRGAISVDDLQGSVTRVRFARLSRIRTILGCRPEENDFPYDAATFVEDDEYLVLDLVLNWAADGLLLAFFHAIRDKDTAANNDPARSREEWSNFCGTAHMPEEQIEALHADILHNIPIPPQDGLPPRRVFQLYTLPESGRPAQLVFTWPPSRTGPSPRYDGTYDAEEYTNLMEGVDMDPARLPFGNEVRTNCTSRFGTKHSINKDGLLRHVHSVWIPYGSLIFACFQTTYVTHADSPSIAVQPAPHDWVTPPLPPRSQDRPAERYEELYQTPQSHHSSHIGSSSASFSNHHASGPSHQTPVQFHQGYPSPGIPYGEHYTPNHSTSSTVPANSSISPDQVDQHGASNGAGGSGRPMVKPPGEIEQCGMCGTKESPEWRRSESGVKDLCNACGLKLARQIAKREGRQKPRKKAKT